jgi:hypothetical protein
MVSRDNGRSFHNRSVLATGRVYEPMLAETTDGELVCVIRGTDQEQRPMLITRSRDHGRTWEPPRPLFGFGVFPALVRLGNGALLLAFGRPGVWVSASLDGGRTWADPVPVIRGDAYTHARTCGYTNLLFRSADDEAMLVYCDFATPAPTVGHASPWKYDGRLLLRWAAKAMPGSHTPPTNTTASHGCNCCPATASQKNGEQ